MRAVGTTIALLMVVLLPAGCVVGYNSALFVTRSNVGIDFETTPPTAEISVSRQAGVIAPTFEDGKTPPLMAGFETDTSGLIKILFGGKSVFAGGAAAVALAENAAQKTPAAASTEKPSNPQTSPNNAKNNDPEQETIGKSRLELSQEPAHLDLPCQDNCDYAKITGPGHAKPMFLMTDTNLGIKIAWNGTAAEAPSKFQVGYNRTEIALAPLSYTRNTCDAKPTGATGPTGANGPTGATGAKCEYSVSLPSFLAVLDTQLLPTGTSASANTAKNTTGTTGAPTATCFYYTDLIATGLSATILGLNPDLGMTVRGIIAGNGTIPSDVTDTPKITDVKPSTGAVGATININGQGFGSPQGKGAVKFGDQSCNNIISWGDKEIDVTVPTGVTGKVDVVVTNDKSKSCKWNQSFEIK
jgi:hypothetical protein